MVPTRRTAAFSALLLLSISMPTLARAAAASPAAADGDDFTQPIIVTGKFVNTGASSATKLDIPVLDTPFSVDAYNKNFLKAIETSNVADLYRYMTGIQRAGNTGYDITFRGFKAGGNDRNAILTDGMPGLSVRFGSPPTIGTDHIELVKGATSVLYGQAQPGGFINIVSKKPQAQAAYEFGMKFNLGAGTYSRALGALASFDATGPITESGSVLYRIVGEIGTSNGFRDYSYEHPIYIAPSISVLPWEGGKITVSGEYRKVRTHYDTYLVAPNNDTSLSPLPTISYQDPYDYLLEEGKIANVFIEQKFSSAIKLSASYRYVDHSDFAQGFDVAGFSKTAGQTLTTLTRRARQQENLRTYSFGDANFTIKGDTLGVGHIILVGASLGKETADLNRIQFYNAPETGPLSLNVNVYAPVRQGQPNANYPLFAVATDLTRRYSTQDSFGAYFSDLLSFGEHVKLMVGLRYANERQSITELRQATPPPQNKRDTKWLPLAGLIIQPTKDLSIYASYSTSFVPAAASAFDVFNTNPFLPTFAKAYEGGIKTNLFDHHLFLTAAYFDITKNNTLNTFTCPAAGSATDAALAALGVVIPTNAPRNIAGNVTSNIASGTCSSQIGAERSRGFELEFNASPLPGLQINGGYAHTTARVAKSIVAVQVGSRLTNSPDDAFNVFVRYDMSDQSALKGLGFGLGVSYIGDRTGLLPTTALPTTLLPLASYTTVDLGIYYKVSEHLDLTFKATNLFDKRYYESAGFTANINLVPGAPRYLTMSARAKF